MKTVKVRIAIDWLAGGEKIAALEPEIRMEKEEPAA
jgi:hypothetical protein